MHFERDFAPYGIQTLIQSHPLFFVKLIELFILFYFFKHWRCLKHTNKQANKNKQTVIVIK